MVFQGGDGGRGYSYRNISMRKAPGRPLHSRYRYTRTDTRVRWGISVTFIQHAACCCSRFSTVQIYSRFASETVTVRNRNGRPASYLKPPHGGFRGFTPPGLLELESSRSRSILHL